MPVSMINALLASVPPQTRARLGWMEAFDKSIDELITDRLMPIAANQRLEFDPYNVEDMLSSASDRLDVCLVRRRDIMDLLAIAVRDARNESFFTATWDLDNKVDDANDISKQAAFIRDAASAAVTQFAKSPENLDHGFAETAKGTQAAASEQATRAATKRTVLQQKADALRELHADLVFYSQTPGHPLNYAERTARVFTLLMDDITVAYKKLQAASAGLELIWGTKSPLPDLIAGPPSPIDMDGINACKANNTLDALVLWTRTASRFVEAQVAKEIVTTLVIPLNSPYAFDGTGNAPFQLTALNPTFNPNDTGVNGVGFELKASYFPGLSSLRLLGIGAAYVCGTFESTRNDFTVVCRVQVDVPARVAVTGEYLGEPLRSITLGCVQTMNVDPPALATAAAIRNATPIGMWYAKVMAGLTGMTNVPVYRADHITDVRLYLRVAGQVATKVG